MSDVSAVMPAAAAPADAAPAVASVKVQLKAVGSAPILRKSKFRINASDTFSTLSAFLRRHLELPESAALFLYVTGSFSPAPTQIIGEIFASFGVEGELVIMYSLTPAYG